MSAAASTPLFVDIAVARALEHAEAENWREFCETAARVHPGKGIRTISVGGGMAMFFAPSDPLNAVKGVGLSGPVDIGEWDAVEALFRESSSPVVVDLCPLADAAFVAMLCERGYIIGSFETVMFRRIGGGAMLPDAALAPGLTVEVIGGERAPVWNRTLDLGFASGGEPVKFSVDIGKVRASMARSTMLLASIDGVPAGGAALSVHGTVVHMSGAAVLPEFRGRGIQQALSAARLRIAQERGCTLAKLDVLAGSGSYRNAVRAGFAVAYTRPQLVKSAKA